MTRQTVPARRMVVEWPTVAMLVLCYGVWFSAGFWLYPHARAAALAVMAVMVALHSSLQHEAIHGHPTRSARLNAWAVFLPLGVLYPYRRYAATHLRHHSDHGLTDPDTDPESYYVAPLTWARSGPLARAFLAANNTFAGRIVLGPPLGAVRFVLAELSRVRSGQRAVIRAWVEHALALVVLVAIVRGVFGVPVWVYLAGPVYGGTALIAVRSFCEHRWHEDPHGRSVIVERTWLSVLFLHNNLHFVHHARPRVPWYRLPGVYRAERAMWLARNGHYVYRGYAQVMWRYLFRRKEPLAHPAAPHLRG